MSISRYRPLLYAALACLLASSAAAGDRGRSGPVEFRLASLSWTRAHSDASGDEPATEQAESKEDKLDERLREILGEEADEREEQEPTFSSPQRQMVDLNPEISILGDFWGILTNEEDLLEEHEHHDAEEHEHEHDTFKSGFRLNEVEISFQAPLDPFSRAKFFVGIHEDELHVEEAYVEWTDLLRGNFQLKAGKFFANFGQLNRWHPHAWPTADTPPALANLFGAHNLSGIGGSLTWLMPPLLGDYNELVFEVFNGDNERAFAGETWKHPVGLLRFKSYNDLSPATYLEIGVSGAVGENEPEEDRMTYLEGVDLSLVWSPPDRSLYRGLESRTELFFSQRDTDEGTRDSFSLLSYTEVKFARRWSAGGRFDYVQNTVEDVDASYGGAAFLNFWQSEFVRIRFEYAGLNLEGESWRHRGILQVTFALGPHKHERY